MTRRGKAWQRLAPKTELRPAMHCEQICKSALAGVSVLIVEDEKLVAIDVENLLRDFGVAQVWSTGTLSGARRILSGNKDISVVLLDIKLQDGSGEELFGELTQVRVPFIITTGYAAYVCAQAPVIYKPYSTGTLVAQILELLRIAIQPRKSPGSH
jgi:DNA-binding NtrC family response regulator